MTKDPPVDHMIAMEKRHSRRQQRERRLEKEDEKFRARLRQEFESWIVNTEKADPQRRDYYGSGSGMANGLIGWLSGAAHLASSDPDLDNRLSLLLYGFPRGKREP
jgi:hypothetical protein